MIRKSGCTTSNISIDYLVKKKFNVYGKWGSDEGVSVPDRRGHGSSLSIGRDGG